MADSKLTALTAGSAVADADLFYSSQSAASRKITAAQLKTYAQSTGGSAFTQGSVVFAGPSGVFAQDNSNFFWDNTAKSLNVHTVTVNTGTITTNTPAFNFAQTWNNAGVNFVGMAANITNTASSGGSFIVDWAVDSSRVFGVRSDGATYSSIYFDLTDTVGLGFSAGFLNGLYMKSSYVLGFSSGANWYSGIDAAIGRNAVGVLEVNNGTAGTFRDLVVRQLHSFQAVAVGVVGVLVDSADDVVIRANSSNTSSTAFILNNSSAGGHNFQFFSTGSANNPGFFGVFDATSGKLPFAIDGTTTNTQLANTSILAWAAGTSANTTTLDTGIYRNAAGVVEINNGTAATYRDLKLRDVITTDATFIHKTTTALTNNAAAATGTLLNAPAAGNPTKWIAIDDNGTTRYIPAW